MSAKILVIRGGAIGDFVLTLPVVAALHAQFPAAEVHVLGSSRVMGLAVAGNAAAARSIESRGLAAFFARNGELAPDWREYFAGFAIIISYLFDPDGYFEANVARCSKARFIAGPHRPDDGAGVHATDVLLKPLEHLAIFDADPVPRLDLRPPSGCRPSAVVVHPGSGSERKNWPEARWSELLGRVVSETSFPVLLVGGEAEGERLERLAGKLATERVEVLRSAPLVDLAGRLGRERVFLGHDSGVTHLASAVGLPGLVLWGETSRAVWEPRGGSMRVIEAGANLAGLPSSVVWEELGRLLGEVTGRG